MKRAGCLLALAWFLILPGAVLAQDELLAFRGVVITAQGEPWAGATVTLEREGQPPRSVVVDGSGEFAFEGIPPGSYKLTVQAEGFATFTQVFDLNRRISRGMLLLFANPEGGWRRDRGSSTGCSRRARTARRRDRSDFLRPAVILDNLSQIVVEDPER